MRKNFSDVAFYPQPVLVIATYDENGVPNAMNVAWGGLCGSKYVDINISRGHKTTEKKAFTMSFADQAHLVEADYFGLVSSHKENKIEKAGMHAVKSEFVDAPILEEFPLTLECQLVSYDHETERAIGQVVNTLAEDSILTEGRIDLEKFHPITYDPANHHYIALGKQVGRAFSDGKQLSD